MKEVEFGHVDATELRVKPHLPALGPRLGKELGAVRAALAAGEFEELAGGGFRVLGHELAPDEVLVERSASEGWAVGPADGVTVALDTALDEELELEGRVYDLVHTRQLDAQGAGPELTDRIALTLRDATPISSQHAEWIKRAESLAPSTSAQSAAEARAVDEGSRALALGVGERQLAAQLDRQPEGHVLVDHPERLDPSTPRARNQSQTRVDELLRGRRAGRDADRPDAVEPGLVDLGLVVDQVRGDAAGAGDVDEAVRVRRVARADHEQEVDLGQHLLHRPLPVGGRVADVLLLRRLDRGKRRRSTAMISAVSSTESVVCVM